MKKNLFICAQSLWLLASPAGAAVVVGGNWTVGTAIPEGSPVGITESETFQNLDGAQLSDVTVNLDITGGYNGGLYGYLVYQDANGNTATEILLNKMGTSPSNPFGSSGSGLNVTLSDSGTANGSIHNAAGSPTGTWLADSTTSLDGTFGGMSADGTWTLFLADEFSGGGTSTLQSWGLDISTVSVPEASTMGLVAGLGCLLFVTGKTVFQRRHKQTSETISV